MEISAVLFTLLGLATVLSVFCLGRKKYRQALFFGLSTLVIWAFMDYFVLPLFLEEFLNEDNDFSMQTANLVVIAVSIFFTIASAITVIIGFIKKGKKA